VAVTALWDLGEVGLRKKRRELIERRYKEGKGKKEKKRGKSAIPCPFQSETRKKVASRS